MLLTGESEFYHPAPSPANLNLNLSLEFNSTTDVNVAYEVIIIYHQNNFCDSSI